MDEKERGLMNDEIEPLSQRERSLFIGLTNASLAISNTSIGIRRLAVAQLNALKGDPSGALQSIGDAVGFLDKAEEAMDALMAILQEIGGGLDGGKQ